MAQHLKQNFKIYLFSFLLPILIVATFFVILKVYPSGNRTIMITDLWHQYIHFYHYLSDSLKGDNSLLYSWNTGLGGNFIGNLAYYASSPFLVIILFFKESYFIEAVTLLILLKIGLSGLSISYFIQKKFPTFNKIEIIFFSLFYALMSFNIVYFYNVMWLDGVIWLPLLILATERLVYQKKLSLFILLLTLIFISNFYIAYMIGLFIFFYFLAEVIKKGVKKDFLILGSQFIVGTTIAAGISAILTVPTFFQLLLTESQPTNFKNTLLNPLHLVYRLFSGSYDSVLDSVATPNLYIGSFVLILVPFFFLNKNIKKVEKFKWGFLLLFLFLSMEIPFLNMIWHGGDAPNSFPYRYSFIVSFVLLVISLHSYRELNFINIKKLSLLYLLTILVILSSYMYSNESLKINQGWTIIFISLFTLFLLIKNKNFKLLMHLLFIIYAFGEITFNTGNTFIQLTDELGGISRDQYEEFGDYANAIEKLKEIDPTVHYRIDTDLNKTLNDSITLRYSGLSHFSSMVNYELSSTLKDLGFSVIKAKYFKDGSTLFSEALLGQKYLISSNEINKYGYEYIDSYRNLKIYQNENALPIGFLVNEGFKEINPSDFKEPFALQNTIFSRLIDKNDRLFRTANLIKTEYRNAKIIEQDKATNLKKIIRINKNQPFKIIYTIKNEAENNEELYTHILTNKLIKSKLSLNNKELTDYTTNEKINTGIFNLGSPKDEQVRLELTIDENEVEIGNQWFYYGDLSKLTTLQSLDTNSFVINSLKENYLTAQVSTDKENQLVFLTIPFDRGWKIEVNNQFVKPVKMMGSFIGIPIDKGESEIKLTFIPYGFEVGRIITIISIFVLLFLIYFEGFKKISQKEEKS